MGNSNVPKDDDYAESTLDEQGDRIVSTADTADSQAALEEFQDQLRETKTRERAKKRLEDFDGSPYNVRRNDDGSRKKNAFNIDVEGYETQQDSDGEAPDMRVVTTGSEETGNDTPEAAPRSAERARQDYIEYINSQTSDQDQSGSPAEAGEQTLAAQADTDQFLEQFQEELVDSPGEDGYVDSAGRTTESGGNFGATVAESDDLPVEERLEEREVIELGPEAVQQTFNTADANEAEVGLDHETVAFTDGGVDYHDHVTEVEIEGPNGEVRTEQRHPIIKVEAENGRKLALDAEQHDLGAIENRIAEFVASESTQDRFADASADPTAFTHDPIVEGIDTEAERVAAVEQAGFHPATEVSTTGEYDNQPWLDDPLSEYDSSGTGIASFVTNELQQQGTPGIGEPNVRRDINRRAARMYEHTNMSDTEIAQELVQDYGGAWYYVSESDIPTDLQSPASNLEQSAPEVTTPPGYKVARSPTDSLEQTTIPTDPAEDRGIHFPHSLANELSRETVGHSTHVTRIQDLREVSNEELKEAGVDSVDQYADLLNEVRDWAEQNSIDTVLGPDNYEPAETPLDSLDNKSFVDPETGDAVYLSKERAEQLRDATVFDERGPIETPRDLRAYSNDELEERGVLSGDGGLFDTIREWSEKRDQAYRDSMRENYSDMAQQREERNRDTPSTEHLGQPKPLSRLKSREQEISDMTGDPLNEVDEMVTQRGATRGVVTKARHPDDRDNPNIVQIFEIADGNGDTAEVTVFKSGIEYADTDTESSTDISGLDRDRDPGGIRPETDLPAEGDVVTLKGFNIEPRQEVASGRSGLEVTLASTQQSRINIQARSEDLFDSYGDIVQTRRDLDNSNTNRETPEPLRDQLREGLVNLNFEDNPYAADTVGKDSPSRATDTDLQDRDLMTNSMRVVGETPSPPSYDDPANSNTIGPAVEADRGPERQRRYRGSISSDRPLDKQISSVMDSDTDTSQTSGGTVTTFISTQQGVSHDRYVEENDQEESDVDSSEVI